MGFNLGFNILNPFFKGEDTFKELFSYSKKLTKNKFLEVNVDKSKTSNFIEFNFRGNFKGQDHAGVEISGRLGDISASIEFRDSRHWNYHGNCWMMDSSEWFNEFKKQVDKTRPGSYILFNNVSDYYQDGLTPEKAVEQFLVDDNIENYFYNGSEPSVIPDNFIVHAEIVNGECKSLLLDIMVLKYYNSPRIDVTYNGIAIENVTYVKGKKWMDNPPIVMGDIKDYRDYQLLDRSPIRAVGVVVDPATFCPIYSIYIDDSYPRVSINDCFVKGEQMGVHIKYVKSRDQFNGYIPEIYYK